MWLIFFHVWLVQVSKISGIFIWKTQKQKVLHNSPSLRWFLLFPPYVHECMLNHFSSVWLFATLLTIACQAPLSTRFSNQEYWSGLPCPPPGDLPNPGVEPVSFTSSPLAGKFFTTSTTWEALFPIQYKVNWISTFSRYCIFIWQVYRYNLSIKQGSKTVL